MEGFYLALGVTFVLPFLQWAVPTMPKIVAYAGVTGGILVMLAEFLDPAMKPPFPAVILFLIGVLCIGGAAHLYIQFLKSSKTPEKVAGPVEAAPSAKRGPTLEATNDSKIDATGAVIPGDLPFQFGKADSGSLIDMPGVVVTQRGDGIITISPPAHTNRTFPPPTGEFTKLSSSELSEQIHATVSDLRHFQEVFNGDINGIDRNLPKAEIGEKWNAVGNKYSLLYKDRFSKRALSLASEALVKIGTVEGSSMSPSAREGGTIVYHGMFVGIRAAGEAADFLEMLARELDKKELSKK